MVVLVGGEGVMMLGHAKVYTWGRESGCRGTVYSMIARSMCAALNWHDWILSTKLLEEIG